MLVKLLKSNLGLVQKKRRTLVRVTVIRKRMKRWDIQRQSGGEKMRKVGENTY